MILSRRSFVALAAGGAVAAPAAHLPIQAVAFDAFVIFDPRPVTALADRLFPGAGLTDEWRTRQFEYCWLRVCARDYADFWRITSDSLTFAARTLGLDIRAADRERLLGAFLNLKPWPDVLPALRALSTAGIHLALLSNFTPAMLEANVRSAGLDGLFTALISTDAAQTYKPDPRAYALGVATLRAARRRTLFAAFAGWDAAGAARFGYPTFWVNRQQLPPEELTTKADASGVSLADLVTYVNNFNKG